MTATAQPLRHRYACRRRALTSHPGPAGSVVLACAGCGASGLIPAKPRRPRQPEPEPERDPSTYTTGPR